MSRRGIFTKPNDGLSVEWLTPPHVIKALGKFDLDPCAHPDQFYRTARRMIAPPDCGLSTRWSGRVWLNPPYGSGLHHWMCKMAKHGNGIALVPGRTEVESWFWPYVWEMASGIMFVRGRFRFHRPDKSTSGNAGHGSVLVAYGHSNVAALDNAASDGTIRGRVVSLI